MNTLKINENGTVTVNGEVANYDNLLESLTCVGEYETKDCGKLALFECEGGYIEYLLDSCFASGESTNYTSLSFDDIMNYYEVQ